MQLREYNKVVGRGMRLDVFYMLWDGEWWACQKDGHQLEFCGEYYRKICEAEFVGNEGARVLGYLKVDIYRNHIPLRYAFRVVKDLLMAGYVLQNIPPVRDLHYRNPKYNDYYWHKSRKL